MDHTDLSIQRLATKLAACRSLTAITGSGVSAASGVPTFRGPGGLWRNYRPEDLATAEAFRRNPKLVWEWYDWRRQLIAGCVPNPAHEVLSRWSHEFSQFLLITQNVDGLHERAETRNVVRFHGSIWQVRCWDRCSKAPASWEDRTVPFPSLPPTCAHCGGWIRPGVVWFGESIDPDVAAAAQRGLACDVFLTIGTSAVVYPAASLVHDAKDRGAFTAEINLESTPSSRVLDLSIQGPAEAILPQIDHAIRRRSTESSSEV